jgi:hypothetical protein
MGYFHLHSHSRQGISNSYATAKDSKPRKRWVALFGKVGGTFWNDAIWDDRGIAVWSMLPYMGENSCHSE